MTNSGNDSPTSVRSTSLQGHTGRAIHPLGRDLYRAIPAGLYICQIENSRYLQGHTCRAIHEPGFTCKLLWSRPLHAVAITDRYRPNSAQACTCRCIWFQPRPEHAGISDFKPGLYIQVYLISSQACTCRYIWFQPRPAHVGISYFSHTKYRQQRQQDRKSFTTVRCEGAARTVQRIAVVSKRVGRWMLWTKVVGRRPKSNQARVCLRV